MYVYCMYKLKIIFLHHTREKSHGAFHWKATVCLSPRDSFSFRQALIGRWDSCSEWCIKVCFLYETSPTPALGPSPSFILRCWLELWGFWCGLLSSLGVVGDMRDVAPLNPPGIWALGTRPSSLAVGSPLCSASPTRYVRGVYRVYDRTGMVLSLLSLLSFTLWNHVSTTCAADGIFSRLFVFHPPRACYFVYWRGRAFCGRVSSRPPFGFDAKGSACFCLFCFC